MNAQGVTPETPDRKILISYGIEIWSGLSMIIHKNRMVLPELSSNDHMDWESYLGRGSPGGQKIPQSSLSLP